MNATLLHDQYVLPQDQKALVGGLVAIGEQLSGVGGLRIRVGSIDGNILDKLPSGQVNGAAVLDSVENWYQKSLFVLATGQDLGHRGLNFLFGQSTMAGGKAVFSTRRFGGNSLAIMGVEVHELGHAFGLVSEREKRYDRVSRFAGHCVNDCIMRPANNLPEMLEGAERIERLHETSGFCSDCASHLNRVRIAA